MRMLMLVLATVALSACAETPSPSSAAASADVMRGKVDNARLARALAAQPEEARTRYPYRHPRETLEFFGIAPGMTVVEALPGSGWYTKILIPYLGSDGMLIGVDYEQSMWAKFGFFGEDFIEKKKNWVAEWTAEADGWRDGDSAQVSAAKFGSIPSSLDGKADAVLFVRALHNLNRFEGDGGYMSTALSDAYRVLKPGGIVGVVQHQAPDSASDEWASGAKGYLKREFLVKRMQQAGFEFVSASNVNRNPKDQPTAEDIVWRLPPTLVTSREDPELREEMQAIGESNRMTLKFRKPK